MTESIRGIEIDNSYDPGLRMILAYLGLAVLGYNFLRMILALGTAAGVHCFL